MQLPKLQKKLFGSESLFLTWVLFLVRPALAKEPRTTKKSRHILRKYHLIRNFVERGDVKVCKVHTDSNVADPLTKPLPQPKDEAHMRSIGY